LSIFWNSLIFVPIARIGAKANRFFALSVRRHKQRENINKQHRRNQMKFNKWTLGLAALGVVSLASAARADEAKMSQVQTSLSNTTLSGYVDVAGVWRPGTDKAPNGTTVDTGDSTQHIPASAFSKNDGFYLNAVDIALDKPVDEGPWASGYHVEMMFGPDSVPNVDSLGGAGEIRQAYIALRTPLGPNGLDFKVGVFDTIIGYESTSCPLNPNYTRSYGYSIEPTTHTGVLASYKVSDVLTLSAGAADSWSSLNGTTTYESQKTYMGSVALTAPDSFGALKGATLNFGIINSVDSAAEAAGTQTSYYVGMSLPTPSSKVKLGGAFDLLTFNNSDAPGNSANDYIWVAGAFVTISPTDKLSFNFRGEIVDATQIGDGTPIATDVDAPYYYYIGHYAGELTATMQYQIWANVLSRVEFRWDHVDGDAFGATSDTENPYKKNDFLLAVNLVYQF
jgi:hypothetical protein